MVFTGHDMVAVQECPTSGRLWAEAVMMAPRPARKQKGSEALKRCDNDPHVVAAVAQLFQVRQLKITACQAKLAAVNCKLQAAVSIEHPNKLFGTYNARCIPCADPVIMTSMMPIAQLRLPGCVAGRAQG